MPVVRVEEVLNSEIENVWNTLRAVERYPLLMDPVKSIVVVEKGENFAISEWEVVLKGSLLKWLERAEFFPDEYRIQYSQVDGDLQWLRGFWKLRSLSPDVTEAILEIDFEIGIPILQDMLNPIAERALGENARLMLLSLESERQALVSSASAQ